MFNSIEDLKALCGKKPDDMGMDDSNPLGSGKTEWIVFLESASDFARLKIKHWGFENSNTEKLKQAEIFLVKAYIVSEEFAISSNGVSQVSLVGVQSISTRKMSSEEMGIIVKSYFDSAYKILSEDSPFKDFIRDFVISV